MLKGVMRKGLFNRLLAQGRVSNPMIALAIAEAVYPSRRDMFKDTIVSPAVAGQVVEGFLDLGAFTFEEMMTRLWGPGVSPLEL